MKNTRETESDGTRKIDSQIDKQRERVAVGKARRCCYCCIVVECSDGVIRTKTKKINLIWAGAKQRNIVSYVCACRISGVLWEPTKKWLSNMLWTLGAIKNTRYHQKTFLEFRTIYCIVKKSSSFGLTLSPSSSLSLYFSLLHPLPLFLSLPLSLSLYPPLPLFVIAIPAIQQHVPAHLHSLAFILVWIFPIEKQSGENLLENAAANEICSEIIYRCENWIYFMQK